MINIFDALFFSVVMVHVICFVVVCYVISDQETLEIELGRIKFEEFCDNGP